MERRWVFVLLDVLCVLVGKSLSPGCGDSFPGAHFLCPSGQCDFEMRTMVTDAPHFPVSTPPALLRAWRNQGCLSTCSCSRVEGPGSRKLLECRGAM